MPENISRCAPRHFRRRALGVFLLLAAGIISLPPGNVGAQIPEASQLYEKRGISAEAVRQGRLGSCYFHSVVAAMARTKPEMIRGMIHENPDGTFTVQFGDGKKETTYPVDINYSRDNGYDKSEGLWVAVLFRAYAQRVLRESLAAAVNKSDLFALVKDYAGQLIDSNDSVLLAYDRAIRAVVDQYGNINRAKLESNLKEQLKTIPIPEEIKNSLITMLDSGGFFVTMEQEIKQNGELFGAYRAVGQGGMAGRVMQALGGSKRVILNESESAAATALEEATRAHSPIVACTGGSRFHKLLAAHEPLPANTGGWFIDGHCYTVIKFDGADQIVTLRNPWADQPYPDGILKIRLESFVPAFVGIVTTAP